MNIRPHIGESVRDLESIRIGYPLFAPSVLDVMLRNSLKNNYQLQFHVFSRPAAAELFQALKRTGDLPYGLDVACVSSTETALPQI